MYTPPPAMQFNPVNFGSLAPGGQLGQLASVLKQGQPQGGQTPLQNALWGNQTPDAQPTAPGAPAGQAPAPQGGMLQMGMLGGLLPALMQKLGMGGAAAAGGVLPALGSKGLGGVEGGSGPTPTALTGLW